MPTRTFLNRIGRAEESLKAQFLGVVGVKHRVQSNNTEFRQAVVELRIKEPTGFMFGQQRFKEMLVEVMGARASAQHCGT